MEVPQAYIGGVERIHFSNGDLCGFNNGIRKSENLLESIFLLTSQTLECYGNYEKPQG